MDADSDGKITREEFMKAPHRRDRPEAIFEAKDADRDGALTPQELCSGPPAPPPPGAVGSAGVGRTKGPGGKPGAGRDAGLARERPCQKRFIALDADGDMKITQEEFLAVPHRRADPAGFFKHLDGNGDGTVSLAEFCNPATRGF